MQKGKRVNVITPEGTRQVGMVVEVQGEYLVIKLAGDRYLTYHISNVKFV